MATHLRRVRGISLTPQKVAYLRQRVTVYKDSRHQILTYLQQQQVTGANMTYARNLRYRIKRNLPLSGRVVEEQAAADEKDVDPMFNEEFAEEVQAGGIESVRKLMMLHRELKGRHLGYQYHVSADDQKRFNGTCWQTGRMRARAKGADLLFLDSSRSGIVSVRIPGVGS